MTYNLKLMEYYVTGGLPTTVLWSHRPPIGGGECKPVGDRSEIRKSVRSWAWPRGRGCMTAIQWATGSKCKKNTFRSWRPGRIKQ